ncbi:hypothetical protein Gpo141_00007839 [Globisporangium polare]
MGAATSFQITASASSVSTPPSTPASAAVSASSPTAASAPVPKMKRAVYLTGFGQFAGVNDNPAQRLVERIAGDGAVADSRVLEVSAAGSLEQLAPCASGQSLVFLHFGVVSLASQFSLEFVGYNLADFATPDERGRKAKNEVIDPKEGPSLRTSLPLDLLRAQLVPTSKKVHLSTEPGRFIGNWVYFHSLQWIKQQQQAALGSTSRDFATVVLHVPPFSSIPMDEQLRFVRRLIELLANMQLKTWKLDSLSISWRQFVAT